MIRKIRKNEKVRAMSRLIVLVGLWILVVSPFSLLFGHGVKLTIEMKSPEISINAKYHGGRNLPDAGVSVFFEKESKEFLKGKTDTGGDYHFRPDKPGTWIVVVDDLSGHRKKADFRVKQTFFSSSSNASQANHPGNLEKSQTGNMTLNAPMNTPEPTANVNEEPKSSSLTVGAEDYYLLRIAAGVILILGITFFLYRVKKKKESAH